MMIVLFTGCADAECISTEYEDVTVKIVDSYHRNSYTTFVPSGKTMIPVHQSEVNQITVEYDNIEFTINDKYVYETYHTKLGEDATAVLQITKYDNGDVKREIISLK